MAVLKEGMATVSFWMLIVTILLSVLIFVYLWFCYYPGGRKRSDVIDIGELPKYNLTAKVTDDEMYEEAGTEVEYTTQGTEDTYYEQRPKSAMRRDPRDADMEEPPVRRGVQMMEI